MQVTEKSELLIFTEVSKVRHLINSEYRRFWQKCDIPSAFISPETVMVLSKKQLASGNSIIACKYGEQGDLYAFGWFVKKSKILSPLSSGNADHNFIQMATNVASDQVEKAVLDMLKLLIRRGYSIEWFNFPAYSVLNSYVHKLPTQNVISVNYSVCPIHYQDSGEAFLNAVSNKKLEYYKRRLEKKGAKFHCESDLSNLDNWIKYFVANHIIRWKGTGSKYENSENVVHLKNRIEAWVKDGICLRFSIEIDNKFIAHCLAVKEGKHRLIYHAITYDQNYFKFSPGKALILYIAQVMKEMNMNELDFGEGDENYKHSFTTEYRPISIEFISPTSSIGFRLKAKAVKFIRTTPWAYRLATKAKSLLTR